MRTGKDNTAVVLTLVLALLLAGPATAQSQSEREKAAAQSELTAAEAAVASAEAAGAATLAATLFDEARARLAQAHRDWNSSDAKKRISAGLRAIEAGHAARAAEAQAVLVSTNTEIRRLRGEITNLGGTPMAVTLYDPPANIGRSGTSMDRVIVAEGALKVARAAGAESVAPTLLAHAEGILKTARSLARRQRQSDNADHLAFVAEMIARRAEYMARGNAVTRVLPDLRSHRAQFVERTTTTVVVQNEEERAARIAAERSLDDLLRRYEVAVNQGSRSSAEAQQLRQQVDQQSAALRQLQERERASEAARANEIRGLEQALERERNEGRLTSEVLAQRETELRRQREELERLQRDREESERLRAEAERARVAALEQAEQRRVQAEQQSSELREQMEAERNRAAQTEAELAKARDELARRDAANRQRIETMQQELAKLAQTRASERGFIVTLPGLFFDSGKAVLKAGARNTLAKIADQLRINQETRIAIEGHTDSVGSDELNQALSDKRAAAVRDYLVSRGVPADRITTTGLGEGSPVATNDTAAGRQQNRRVELVITTQ